MSIKCMTQVWESSQAKGSELLLLLAIADHASDDGYAWPGIESLAKKIRMTTRTVIRLVEELEKKRELYARHNRRTGNKYVICVGLTDEEFAATLQNRLHYSENEIRDILLCDNFSLLKCKDDTTEVTQMSQESSLNVNEPSLGAGAPGESVGDSDDDYVAIFGEEPNRMPRAAPRSEEEIMEGTKQASESWRRRLREEPWAVWGRDSDEAQKQLRQHNGTAPVIKRLGYELEQQFGLHPVWGDRKDVKSWFVGLTKCVAVSNSDYEIVLEAARQLRDAEMDIADPHSLVKTTRSLKAKQESNQQPQVIRISQ